jgi:hypothetical protein
MYKFTQSPLPRQDGGTRFERWNNKLNNILSIFVKTIHPDMKKTLLICLLALLGFSTGMGAQESVQGIPADVFYLMPGMAQGTLLFRDKSPIPGKFNICAIDNTVRYKDKSGAELAVDDDELVEAIIDNVPFMRRDGVFYRLERLSDEVFLATKREVLLMTDTQTASYGMESNTTAVQTLESFSMEGRVLSFDEAKNIPYRMSESSALYRKGSMLPLTKKNFIKCFPDKKAEIEAWFNENKKMDSTNSKAVLKIAKQWAE